LRGNPHRACNPLPPLCDQLKLTLELLQQDDWLDFDEPEDLAPNVIRFRPRTR